jgi:hypothetical protein
VSSLLEHLLVGVQDLLAVVLQLDEARLQAGDGHDESYPAPVEDAVRPHPPTQRNKFILGIFDVYGPHPLEDLLALGVLKRQRNSALEALELDAIAGGYGLRDGDRNEVANSVIIGRGSQPRI